MIPAPRGYVAQYRHKIGDKVHYIHQPIVAFDEDGDPYVAPNGMGKRFVPAYSIDNYVGVDEDPEPPIVALLPAGGWRIERTDEEDGTTWSGPLVGWGLKADGATVPLASDGEGFVEEPSGDFRVYHPDEVITEKTSEQATATKEAD